MSQSAPAKKPAWAPRMWEGCDFFAWFKLLWHNRFAVHPRQLYIAVIITFVSFGNTLFRLVQDAIFGRVVRKVKMTQPPIFILGHWRSGTTLLHELMICDERFSYPTTFECMAPHQFLLTEEIFAHWFSFLVPTTRPMDNMKAGFDRPQEDEFALCMLGVGSPYLRIAFPNRPPQFDEYLDLENVPPAKLRRWKEALMTFLKMITYKSGKRLVLKSPPHTARIKTLKDMFPDGIFIHIIRDPFVVYASTVNLWRTLYRTQGMQTPTFAGLEEHVLATYLRMYERLEEGKKLLGPERFYEVRYEDLVKDPVSAVARIYEHFGLGEFEKCQPRLEAYLATIKGYETNRYQLTEDQRTLVASRWRTVIERYGYDKVEKPLAD
jgi:hypothetical protein